MVWIYPITSSLIFILFLFLLKLLIEVVRLLVETIKLMVETVKLTPKIPGPFLPISTSKMLKFSKKSPKKLKN
jgi:hypothetical protein